VYNRCRQPEHGLEYEKLVLMRGYEEPLTLSKIYIQIVEKLVLMQGYEEPLTLSNIYNQIVGL